MQTKIMRAQSKAATSDQLLQHSSSQITPLILHDRSKISGILVSIEGANGEGVIANFHLVRKDKHQIMTLDIPVLLPDELY
jgi:hypothetical protein